MTTITLTPTQDSITMVRRRLLHLRRYPTLTVMLVGMPVLFLALFVYVFGGTLGDGLGAHTVGRRDYLQFLAPAILVMAVAVSPPARLAPWRWTRPGASWPASARWRSRRHRS